jgi:hypothetical protein
MEGTLGHFWTELSDVYNLDRSRDGHVRLVDGSVFHVSTLRTREFNSEFGRNRDRLQLPEAVYAMTAGTRAIFFDVAGASQSNVMGQRASTQTVEKLSRPVDRGVSGDLRFG